MTGYLITALWLAGILFWQPRFFHCVQSDYGTTAEDYGEDRRMSIFFAILWPIGLVAFFIIYGSKVLHKGESHGA